MNTNTQPHYQSRKVIDDTITARSIRELDEKLAALGITDDSKVGIRAEVRAVISTETNPETIAQKQNTIRRLRREVRHLRSLLKTKDRILAAQKTFYEAMLDDVQKREGTSKENIEQWLEKLLLKTIKSLGL